MFQKKQPPIKKVKLIHEQLSEKYGIPNQEELFDGTGLKPIPKPWLWEMVNETISEISAEPYSIKKNDDEKNFVLTFDSEELQESFSNMFKPLFFNKLNSYIEEQNEDPKRYNRAAVFLFKPSGNQLIIQM